MNPVQHLVDVQERLYVRRDELARSRAVGSDQRPAPGWELKHVEDALKQIEAGLHPVCERCGERIEIDRLQRQPFVLLCGDCARIAAREPGKLS